ncbi:hypothetical protein TNCT_420261 [Trichonephila clavata]|uniref:Uncharacterized protein n=1 Tax=Trichonephila clavata TaxID=2740835 RepID=A0A8X6G9U5_TRICU|nr:hypothetical protein TNCT_420261 [Trichonephila clavata]
MSIRQSHCSVSILPSTQKTSRTSIRFLRHSLPSNQPTPSFQPANQDAPSPQKCSTTSIRSHSLFRCGTEDCMWRSMFRWKRE